MMEQHLCWNIGARRWRCGEQPGRSCRRSLGRGATRRVLEQLLEHIALAHDLLKELLPVAQHCCQHGLAKQLTAPDDQAHESNAHH